MAPANPGTVSGDGRLATHRTMLYRRFAQLYRGFAQRELCLRLAEILRFCKPLSAELAIGFKTQESGAPNRPAVAVPERLINPAGNLVPLNW